MFIDLESEEKKILEELASLEKASEENSPQEEVEEQEEASQDDAIEVAQEEKAEESVIDTEEEDEEPAGLSKKEKKGFAKMRHELKEEKARYNTLAQQLQEMRERQAKLEGIQEGSQIKQHIESVPADNEPDKDLDPDEWRDWKIRKQEAQINEILGTTKQNSEALKIQNELKGIENLEAAHSKKDPEYAEKMSFLKKIEADKLRLIQPNITDDQIEAAILRDKLTVSRHVFEKYGRNPAEIFAELAVNQGYQSKKPGATAPKKQIDIAALNKNMKKNTSLLGGTSQARAGDEISPEELLDMSIEKMSRIPTDRLNRIVSNI